MSELMVLDACGALEPGVCAPLCWGHRGRAGAGHTGMEASGVRGSLSPVRLTLQWGDLGPGSFPVKFNFRDKQ